MVLPPAASPNGVRWDRKWLMRGWFRTMLHFFDLRLRIQQVEYGWRFAGQRLRRIPPVP